MGIQELLGHKDVKTTMVYTEVLNQDWRVFAVQPPFVFLGCLDGIKKLADERELL